MEIFFTILIMTLVVSLSGVAARILPFQIRSRWYRSRPARCWLANLWSARRF